MSDYLQKIIYLSQDDYDSVLSGTSINRNGITLNSIDDNNIYITDGKVKLVDLDDFILPVSKGGTGLSNLSNGYTLSGTGTDAMAPLRYTNNNDLNTLVYRNNDGDFSAGTITAALNGNALTVGAASVRLYPENNNEINFGGSSAGSNVIYFGYRAKDSKAIPSKFIFGGSTGTSNLQANTVYLGSGTTNYINSTNYTGNAETATTSASSKILANKNGTVGTALTTGNRVSNANITHVNNGGIEHFKITKGATNGFSEAGNILHFHWDTNEGWNAQLFIPAESTLSMNWRSHTNNSTWGAWRTLLDSNNYTNYLTTANVQSVLGISSSGSTTKWLNEQGGWTTPTASDVGAAPAVDGGYLPLSGGVMATSSLITIGTNGTHRGIKAGNTYINSINGDLIFQNNGAIRFGTDTWDYNEWAGLKYDHSVKTVYLGLADKNYLKANAAQKNGTTHLVNMRYLYMNTKQILDINLAIDNTAFKNTLLLFINQSNESTTTAFDATKSSWGIGFQRQWNSGTLGQIAAGIYAYGISNWRTGLVFRTKTGTDSASSHDTNALILNHNGDATFIGNVTASDFTGNLNGNATTATTSTYIQGIDQGTSNINIANTITSLGEGKIRYDYRIGKDSTGLFAHSTESNTNAILTFSTASGANYMHQLGFSTDEHLYHRAFIGVAQTNDKAWNEILDSSNYTDYAAAADHTHNYAGSSSAGGAATTVTTANSNAALYLVGVASDATTSLKYNSDIVMNDGTLSLTNIQMSGDTSAITRKIPAWTGGWARQLISVTANDGTTLMSANIYGNAQALSYIYIGTATHNSTDNIRFYTGGKIMAKEFQGNLTGNATSLTNITTTDAATSSDTWRHVWFSYNDNTTGRPAHKDTIAFQTSTDTLKSGKYLIGEHITLEYNSTDDSLDFIFV